MKMADWHASLSFSDRFKWVSELQRANPEDKASAQATENQAYQTSTDKNAYEATIKAAIQRQRDLSAPLPPPTKDEDADRVQAIWAKLTSSHLPGAAVDFNAYKSALPHAQGTSSVVYACPCPTSSSRPLELCALKVTTPSSDPAPHDSVREVRVLRLLSNHPNIISLNTEFRFKGHLVLVFPFLSLSLSDVLHSPSSPSLPQVRKKQILHDLFSGLAFIHNKGVLHRDIKPSNLLLNSPLSGPAQIIDFGTAWLAGDPACEDAREKVLDVGTTSYRAPELLFGGQSYGEGVDLWAAGCVAAELVVEKDARLTWETRGMQGRDEDESEAAGGPGRGNGALFESGDLGSELQLVKSIFETLGTPTDATWPEATNLPDWGKMRFVDFPAKSWDDILPGTEQVEKDFVRRLLNFESGSRMTAEEALQHEYLRDAKQESTS